jgi:hypothetical protein
MASVVQKIKLSLSRDVPFSKLVLSQSNVRCVKSGVSIEQLAESIVQRTLLQSLNVRAVVDAEGNETGMFEVPAGGRRYRALELLVKQKRMAKTQPVPCVVREGGIAKDDSLAENDERVGLHPLDQFRALLEPGWKADAAIQGLGRPLKMMAGSHWVEVDRDRFTVAWLAEVPEFTERTIYVVAGLLLPIWKPLPNESTRVPSACIDCNQSSD